MINNFMFHFLNLILNKPCEDKILKQQWLDSMHEEIGTQYDNGLDDLFQTIANGLYKEGLTLNDSKNNKTIINITAKGIQAYADYLNQIYIPNSNMSIASQANEISREANAFSKEANNLSNEANKIARKANDLSNEANNFSREANNLSKEANKKSRTANWISFFAALIALAGFILSIIALLK